MTRPDKSAAKCRPRAGSLRDSELRLQLALAASGDGLWDWDIRSDTAYLSPTYMAMTGYAHQDPGGAYAFFRRLVHPEDWERVQMAIQVHFAQRTPISDIEYRMVTASGEIRWIRGRGRVVEWHADGTPARMIGHVADVTSRVLVEQALRASETRFRAVVEDQTEMIARFAMDGTITFVNEVYCRMFGKSAEELVGHRWQPIVHPNDLLMIEARLATLSPANPVVDIENRAMVASGEMRWMQFVNRAFFDDQGRLLEIQAVGRDIDRRKRAEQRLRALAEQNTRLGRELIRVQEHERSALARELHDELSQQLVAIRAHAGAIARRSGDQAATRADAQVIGDLVANIYQVSHRLMEGLHPQMLDNAGLAAAIDDALAQWARLHPGTRIRLRFAGNIEPEDPEWRIHIFRILQESLTNVAGHAQATRVRVFVGRRPAGIRLVVRDNGIGTDLAVPTAGFGLIAMRERANSLGGRFRVDSWPGGGLRLQADIPCPPGSAR